MKTALRLLTVAAFTVGLMTVLPSSAGAGGQNTIDVTKVVEGDVPPGTTFPVHIVCSGDGSETADLTFTETGGTQSATFAGFQINCTIVETDNGGAQSTTYDASTDAGTASGGSDGALITFDQQPNGGHTGTVTITNVFPTAPPPPPPAEQPAVVVQGTPTFTG